MVSGDPGKKIIVIKGRGTGTNWEIRSRGERGRPLLTPVSGEGDGGRL
jgi:hypothetical protein